MRANAIFFQFLPMLFGFIILNNSNLCFAIEKKSPYLQKVHIPTQFNIVETGTLAADDECAKYRTHLIDSTVLIIPKDVEFAFSKDVLAGIGKLVDFFKSNTDDEFVIVKRIHDWITWNIAYDMDAVSGISSNINDIPTILKEKRTTCDGYSKLFSYMTTLVGIETITISGISRSSFDVSKNEMSSHVWNAVKINQRWYIVDVTHDDRFEYALGKFVTKRPYRDTQLFIAPSAKIIENRPLTDSLQFLNPTVSKEDFLKAPKVNLNFIELGLQFKTDLSTLLIKETKGDAGKNKLKVTDHMIPENGLVTLEIVAPLNVRLFATLRDSNGNVMENYAFMYRDGESVFCQFSVPDKGKYFATISGCLAEKNKLALPIYGFQISNSQVAGPLLPFANILYLNNNTIGYGIKIVQQNITTQDAVEITLEHPVNVNLFIGIYLDTETAVKVKGTSKTTNGTEFSTTVLTIPASEAKTYYIRVKAKYADQKTYSDIVGTVKIVK